MKPYFVIAAISLLVGLILYLLGTEYDGLPLWKIAAIVLWAMVPALIISGYAKSLET